MRNYRCYYEGQSPDNPRADILAPRKLRLFRNRQPFEFFGHITKLLPFFKRCSPLIWSIAMRDAFKLTGFLNNYICLVPLTSNLLHKTRNALVPTARQLLPQRAQGLWVDLPSQDLRYQAIRKLFPRWFSWHNLQFHALPIHVKLCYAQCYHDQHLGNSS